MPWMPADYGLGQSRIEETTPTRGMSGRRGMTTYAIQTAIDHPHTATEARHRVACLRGLNGTRSAQATKREQHRCGDWAR